MAHPGSGVITMRRSGAAFAIIGLILLVAGVGFFAAGILLSGCTATAVIDDASPHCVDSSIAAGSDLTESSQYAEVRMTFDGRLEADGTVADDLEVLVNGKAPDADTMATEAYVDGSDVVVRLVPTTAADGRDRSVYYAFYDGLVSVAARGDDGGLPHVKGAGGSSNAVLDAPVSFTVPSGIEIQVVDAVPGDAETGTPASVSFDIEQFAQLRCCTWYSFSDDLPLVMMHNHEFLRDTVQTCADRLAGTLSATYGDYYTAEADGARVTVHALDVVDGQQLSAAVVEGRDVNPAFGMSGDVDLDSAPGAPGETGSAYGMTSEAFYRMTGETSSLQKMDAMGDVA